MTLWTCFSNEILLPLGGLFIAVFAGWAMKKEATRDELNALSLGSIQFGTS